MLTAGVQFDPNSQMLALCCECGTLRALNRRRYNNSAGTYYAAIDPTNGCGAVGEQNAFTVTGYWHYQRRRPEHLRSMQSQWDRAVCLATCATCPGDDRGRTRHALIFPESHREKCGDRLETEMLAAGIREPIDDGTEEAT